MTALTPTVQLAQFAAELHYDDLPSDVQDIARTLLIDTLGCAVAGHSVDKGAIPVALAAEAGGAAQASVLGADFQAPLAMACLANGELMNALDFDAILAPGHVTPFVMPPTIAFAEHRKASGADLLLAVVLAHEVGCRVSAALDGMRQWEVPGPDGRSPLSPASGYGSVIFGAVAGAARLLGFDTPAMANLFGIAGYAAPVPGLTKFVTAPHSFHVKYTSAGQLAMNAAVSVQLAERGFHGDETVLDGEYGFWRMFASRRCDWDFMLGDLGTEWRIRRAEIKPFPAFRMSHDALGTLRRLMSAERIEPDKVTRIKVTADPLCISDCYLNTELRDHTDGQLSWRHLVAAATFYERPASWQVEAMNDERVRKLAQAVEIVPIGDSRAVERQLEAGGEVDRAFPAWLKSEVTIETDDRTCTADSPAVTKGHPENPLSDAELDEKFLSNTSVALGARARLALDLLKNAPEHGAAELVAALRPAVPSGDR